MKQYGRTLLKLLVFMFLVLVAFSLQYLSPMLCFLQNRSVFESAVPILRETAAGIEDAPITEPGDVSTEPLQLSASVSGDAPRVTLFSRVQERELGQNPTYLEDGTPEFGFYHWYHDRPSDLTPPEGSPLGEALLRLKACGVSSLSCYDFQKDGGDAHPSPCELWFFHSESGAWLIYSQNGRLTRAYDLVNGPGYRLSPCRMGIHWFVAFSRYDASSDYWKG